MHCKGIQEFTGSQSGSAQEVVLYSQYNTRGPMCSKPQLYCTIGAGVAGYLGPLILGPPGATILVQTDPQSVSLGIVGPGV